jgi:NTP pyrophosphatase (non-canonical NTP hydrolase)
LEFRDYESAAARTVNPALDSERRMMDAAAGLAEESGEVLGKVRKHLYQARPLDRSALIEELGDVLWCLAMTSRAAGLSLEEVAWANIEKLRKRYPNGFPNEAQRGGGGNGA